MSKKYQEICKNLFQYYYAKSKKYLKNATKFVKIETKI